MKLFKYIKEFLAKSENIRIVLLVVVWRIWICVFALLGIAFLPRYSPHFFGGGLEKYSANPLFWGWANFDGEHYISIAEIGYKPLEFAFFPGYPFLLRFLATLIGLSQENIVLAGLVVSNLAIVCALVIFWRLVRLDYSSKIAWYSIFALLAFPTSFYFGSVYTESLYFFMVILSFYLFRKGRYIWLTFVGAISSAVRIFGATLMPTLVIEYIQNCSATKQKFSIWVLLSFLFIPAGFLLYMYFVYKIFGDPLDFYRLQTLVGEQRSAGIVLLPQVFWRYAKLLATITTNPIYFTIIIETIVAVGSLALIFWGYLKKMRLSYLAFAFMGYILPTFTGSFSSLPRYVLVLFPLFILLGIFLSERGKLLKITFFTVSIILLAIEVMLFIRGYWVA